MKSVDKAITLPSSRQERLLLDLSIGDTVYTGLDALWVNGKNKVFIDTDCHYRLRESKFFKLKIKRLEYGFYVYLKGVRRKWHYRDFELLDEDEKKRMIQVSLPVVGCDMPTSEIPAYEKYSKGRLESYLEDLRKKKDKLLKETNFEEAANARDLIKKVEEFY